MMDDRRRVSITVEDEETNGKRLETPKKEKEQKQKKNGREKIRRNVKHAGGV